MRDLRVIKRRNKYVLIDYHNGRKQIAKSFKYKKSAEEIRIMLLVESIKDPNIDLIELGKDLQIKLLQDQVLQLKRLIA